MNKATILIVEDDGLLATYLDAVISRLGYDIAGPVPSGEEALACLHGRPIDLVLMDIELSGPMNGITAAEKMVSGHDIPVIFLTGFSQDSLIEQAKNVDPYGYLIKPVSERELAASVEMALHRHALSRKLKQSYAELEKSEAKYRNLFESLPIGIFRTTPAGTVLDGNYEMMKIVGCSSRAEVREYFFDMPGQLYVDPDRRQELIALLRQQGEVKNFEIQARKKSGEIIWMALNARICAADATDEPVIEGFAQDITDRKQAQEALLASEERYRLISSLTSDIAYSCRKTAPGCYGLDWIVGAAERITGYSLEEIIAQRCWRFLVAEEDIPLFEQKILGLFPDESSHCQLRIRHKDGSLRWVECTTKCLAAAGDAGASAIYGSMVDITERKRSEEVLRLVAESGYESTQDIFQFLVRQLATSQGKRSALLARIDPVDESTAHTLAVWQDGGFVENFSYRLDGTPCENVVSQGICFYGRGICSLFPRDHLLSFMGAESYWGTPLRDTAGRAIGVLAVIDDHPMEETPQTRSLITTFAARAAGELERRLTEKKYQTLFREMLDGFAIHEIICDPAGAPVDYWFLDVNPAFERITGLQRSAVIGKTVREVLPGIDDYWIETYGKVALTGASIFFEHYAEELGRYFEIKAFRPESNRFACIFTDISDRKRSEEERVKLRDQLYHAQKMEDIGRLIGGVAHDFNNHLTAILGCSHLILEKLSADSDLRAFAEIVYAAGEKASALTRSLLAFSRKESFEKKPVDVQVIIANIGKLLRRLIGEDIELVITPGEQPLFVNGDCGQLEQVLMNLTTNARDAMPDGGAIRIVSEHRWLDHEFISVYGWGEPGEYAVITVSDTGTGIPEEDHQRVFEPFYTSKESGKGTGLGLSNVYSIIKQHEGHILLDSAPGEGSSFSIFLPLLCTQHDKDSEVTQPVPPGGIETVLICEDDASVRRLARLVLEDAGYRVFEAVDGQDAVDEFRRHQDEIQLVILDVVMPKKNGVAVYSEIRGMKPEVRVIFTSGYTPDTINRSGVFNMQLPFIQKPITPRILLEKLREALDAPRKVPV